MMVNSFRATNDIPHLQTEVICIILGVQYSLRKHTFVIAASISKAIYLNSFMAKKVY
jgi:hypothetical protein